MIAVIGRLDDPGTIAIARRAAREEARVELVVRVPPGAAGDARLVEAAAAGVGHAAALRSAGMALEPADLDLALRYLPDLRVVVVAADGPSLLATAAASAGWAGARLVVVSGPDAGASLPDDAIVLAAPAADPDEAFAGMVAALASRLDRGDDPRMAWAAVRTSLGLEPTATD